MTRIGVRRPHSFAPTRLFALATLLVATAIAPAIAQGGKTVAREQSFYESLTFGEPLRSAELFAALDRLVVPPGKTFTARFFKGAQEWPRLCAGLFAVLGSHEVNVTLYGSGSGTARGYYFAIAGIPPVTAADFGTLKEVGDHIEVNWYHCGATVSHSLHATADRRHFLFKVKGEPMLAWSAAGN